MEQPEKKSRRQPYSAQKVTDLGGGVWSLPIPFPGNPLGYTLVYAIESPGGPVLIDAGWNHPDAWQALRSGLSTAGMDITDVRGVIVTHFHPDHAGLAGQVREASGGWLAMHAADIELIRLMRSFDSGQEKGFQSEMLRRAGADVDAAADAVHARPEPPALPDLTLGDGELADVPGRRLRAIWTPGHSPGHLCLHLEDGDRVFTGDHVLPDITPHVGIYPFDRTDVDPLTEFLGSLEKVGALGPIEALPAHEHAFPDVAARTKAIREHHEEKLDQLLTQLRDADGPMTIWEIAAGMRWNRAWDQIPAMMRGAAAGEAAAHLRTLEVRRLISRTTDEPVRFHIDS